MDRKLASAIRLIVSRWPRIGRTSLVKCLYLADLAFLECYGQQITDLEYRWKQHGPYDRRIVDALKGLTAIGQLDEGMVDYPSGFWGYRYETAASADSAVFVLAQEETEALQSIVDAYRDKSLDVMLHDVYGTLPMLDVKERRAYGEPLRMELADLRKFEGLDLERIRQADDDLNDGRGIPLRDVLAKANE